MEDLSLRTEFHRALDPFAPPAPWLAQQVRQELRRRMQSTRPWHRPRSRLLPALSPQSRRLIAVALVVLLAVAAAWVSITIHQYVRHPIPVIPHTGGPVSRECGQASVYMVDSNIGWRGTSRTTDGGQTWRDVSPPAPPGAIKGGGSVCSLDPNHAWATWGTGTDSYQPTNVVVMSTRDGGQSWQQTAVIAIGYPVSWRIGFAVEMDFFDLQHGWLLMEYATTPMVRTLYATSDGGVHWAVVSRVPGLGLGSFTIGCSENGMMFVTLQRGWLTWTCTSGYGDYPPYGGPVIAMTNDGGRTWAPLNLDAFPTERTCGATTPIFSGRDGLLQVSCLGTFPQRGWTALYSSVDGGQAWAVHVLPVFVNVDRLNGDTAFYFSFDGRSNTLYRSTDGGTTWTVVANALFPGSPAGDLTFIDAKNGFVGGSPSPWWTHDGGKTWSLPAPYRSVGSAVCDVFSDPGAGNAPKSVRMFSQTVGWAAGTRRTTDGGADWSNVSPPAPKYRSSGYSELFLDATHAWVADAVGSSTACADHFVVYSTLDGGATWKQGTPTPVQLPADVKLGGFWAPFVDFVDADHGWLTLQLTGQLSGAHTLGLYATSDGGRHWTFLAAQLGANDAGCNAVGVPDFTSPTTGWMRVFCNNQGPDTPLRFLVTRDGGKTWSLQTVAEKNGCCVNALPEFFDGSHGWILDANSPSLLMTSDGGETWTSHGLPQFHYFACQGKFGPTTCSSEGIITGSFIDPNEGWLALYYTPDQGAKNYVQIQHTLNGGKTWAIVNSDLMGVNPRGGPEQVMFVDQSNGFIWTGTVLLRTTDGGHTWAPVNMTYS